MLEAFLIAFVWLAGFFAARGNYARQHEMEHRPGRFREGWLMLSWPFRIMRDVIREQHGR